MIYAYNLPLVLGVLALAPATTGGALAPVLGRSSRAWIVGALAVLAVAGIAGVWIAPWNSSVESWPYIGRQFGALAIGTLFGLASIAWSARRAHLQLVAVRRYTWLIVGASSLGLCFGASGYAMTASLAGSSPENLYSSQQLALAYAVIALASLTLLTFASVRLLASKNSPAQGSVTRAV